MSDSIDQLREMKAKLDLKWARLQQQVVAVGTERDEIDTAIRVLERLHGQDASPPSTITNENGVLILKYVGAGEDEAQAPKEIQSRIVADGHDLNADLVRTQLWRMAQRGLLESDNGKYWKPREKADPFAQYAEAVEVHRKRADDEWGAGEQARQTSGFTDDLEEDVPF
jgi:hypothetical protein